MKSKLEGKIKELIMEFSVGKEINMIQVTWQLKI